MGCPYLSAVHHVSCFIDYCTCLGLRHNFHDTTADSSSNDWTSFITTGVLTNFLMGCTEFAKHQFTHGIPLAHAVQINRWTLPVDGHMDFFVDAAASVTSPKDNITKKRQPRWFRPKSASTEVPLRQEKAKRPVRAPLSLLQLRRHSAALGGPLSPQKRLVAWIASQR